MLLLRPSGKLLGNLPPMFYGTGLQLACEEQVSVKMGILSSLFQGKLARQSGSDTLRGREREKSLPDEDWGCNTVSIMTGKTVANPFRGLFKKTLILHRDHICFPRVKMGIRAV